MQGKESLNSTDNDACAREVRQLRDQSTRRRTSTAKMHAQENRQQHRERCVHKRTLTAPRTMHAQEKLNSTEGNVCTRKLRRLRERCTYKGTLTQKKKKKKTINVRENFDVTENDPRTRELRQQRCSYKRTSTAPRTMHAQGNFDAKKKKKKTTINVRENFNDTENDACTKEFQQHREQCVHKRISTVPKTIDALKNFDDIENDKHARELQRFRERCTHNNYRTREIRPQPCDVRFWALDKAWRGVCL
ncbi:hypothetical protein PoB_003796900 [Plakobranchus ocellatus]|uniref:Uncharacterized protein n=1 Tax=Plakobranchus ocellatus TaxID=259542 RepID=A0AAV4AUJ7_9GAST|nr:hypothetical protein PoB_003796900 [Plakobranchus ocellatus]